MKRIVKYWECFFLLPLRGRLGWCFLLISLSSFAQQHPIYNQYMFNRMAINPAYAGSKDALTTTLLLRNQWVGIEGAPTTQTLTIHSPITKKKVGLGFSVFGDQIGPRKMTGIAGIYSYHLTLPKGKLAMGVRFGFYQYVYNWNAIDHLDNGDPVYQQTVNRFIVPSSDAGVYYNNTKFYGGLSFTQLLNGHISTTKTAIGDNTHLIPHVFLIGAYGFQLNENVIFNPGINIRGAKGVPLNADFNFNVQLQGKIWAGVSFRTSKALVLIAQMAITSKLNLGYSFDYNFNPITHNTLGSHELMLEYNLSTISKSKVLSPRNFYF